MNKEAKIKLVGRIVDTRLERILSKINSVSLVILFIGEVFSVSIGALFLIFLVPMIWAEYNWKSALAAAVVFALPAGIFSLLLAIQAKILVDYTVIREVYFRKNKIAKEFKKKKTCEVCTHRINLAGKGERFRCMECGRLCLCEFPEDDQRAATL